MSETLISIINTNFYTSNKESFLYKYSNEKLHQKNNLIIVILGDAMSETE